MPFDLHGCDAARPRARAPCTRPCTHNKCNWKSILKRNRILLRNSKKNFFPVRRTAVLEREPRGSQQGHRHIGASAPGEQMAPRGSWHHWLQREAQRAPRTEGPSHSGRAFHTSEPLVCCVASVPKPSEFLHLEKAGQPSPGTLFCRLNALMCVKSTAGFTNAVIHVSGASRSTQPGPQGSYFLAQAS